MLLAWIVACIVACGLPALLGAGRAVCSYERAYGYLNADCADRKLTDVPHLRNSIEALDISDNKIKTLKNDSFASTPDLRFLYLNENKIRFVEISALARLQMLEVLDLSSNSLHQIPRGLLELPRLRKLYFADNFLQFWDPGFTFSSPTLQLLSLADCHMSSVPIGALPSLLHLNVSGNDLVALPLQEISMLCRLEILDIANNTNVFRSNSEGDECDCHIFKYWADLREVKFINDNVPCWNQSSKIEDSYKECNASKAFETASDLNKRCEVAQRMELQTAGRNWWLRCGGLALGSIVAVFVMLACYQRRNSRRKTHEPLGEVVDSPRPAPASTERDYYPQGKIPLVGMVDSTVVNEGK